MPKDDDREPDDYDRFLDTWEPSERLEHASLEQHLNDPYSRARLFDDSTGEAAVERTPFAPGIKEMMNDELVARRFELFADHQAEWASGFEDQLRSRDVPAEKVTAFVYGVANDWVDGKARRQDSKLMRSIKASIRDFDRLTYPGSAGKFVVKQVEDDVVAFFTPQEMAAVFTANLGLIDAYMPEYVEALEGEGPDGVSGLYVRRGVMMPAAPTERIELYELSSYSLGLGAVEQFAQTWTPATRGTGVATIFSAPLAAVQDRIVAFAPFIAGMALDQLELVVAPPVAQTPLIFQGEYGGIREYLFR